MGWTITHKRPGETVKAFFHREFDFEDADGRWGRVVDCAVVGCNTAYLAYATGDAGGVSKVGAMVCLLCHPRGYHNFGYKDMDESLHPFYYDCPERILRRLTPCDDEEANRWRQKCWERLAARTDGKRRRAAEWV